MGKKRQLIDRYPFALPLAGAARSNEPDSSVDWPETGSHFPPKGDHCGYPDVWCQRSIPHTGDSRGEVGWLGDWVITSNSQAIRLPQGKEWGRGGREGRVCVGVGGAKEGRVCGGRGRGVERISVG